MRLMLDPIKILGCNLRDQVGVSEMINGFEIFPQPPELFGSSSHSHKAIDTHNEMTVDGFSQLEDGVRVLFQIFHQVCFALPLTYI